jgi:hypothetical protein
MTKRDAILLFGTTHREMADALGITRAAITQWPDELTREQADRVVGAAVRLGRWKPRDNAEQEAA